ncbi:MAG: alpha/beta fold hydrolase [Cyanobacteria bacterium SZAS LIN-2]|nr:alpha/beta fold hydrolase [Cyanobacteria bacterium SZAS LIN-3]MBS1995365.1 alpha/beta fold hydrolase [Cyanobacteria bacterium SZAS LIN-2]
MAGVAQVQPVIDRIEGTDGVSLMRRVWKGKSGAPVILYLHGIEGHSGWFENTASVLNARGMTIYAPDRRGAGLNQRDRGNLSSYKDYLNDIELALRKITFDHVGHPIIIVAHCWGAKAAALIVQRDYKPVGAEALNLPIAGVVFVAPAIYSKVDYGMSTKFQIAYNTLLGGDAGSHRKWPLPIEVDMFTDNPTYQGYLKRDTMRLTEVTASLLVENLKISKLAEKAAGQIDMPVLMLQGGSDRIVDLEKLQSWYGKIPSQTKDLRIFPDSQHCLDFDEKWFKEYTHVLSEWILARCPVVT